VNVGVEKKSSDLIPFFFHPFKGKNSTVGTTDVEEDLHSLES
jgi:hypothetical protein